MRLARGALGGLDSSLGFLARPHGRGVTGVLGLRRGAGGLGDAALRPSVQLDVVAIFLPGHPVVPVDDGVERHADRSPGGSLLLLRPGFDAVGDPLHDRLLGEGGVERALEVLDRCRIERQKVVHLALAVRVFGKRAGVVADLQEGRDLPQPTLLTDHERREFGLEVAHEQSIHD